MCMREVRDEIECEVICPQKAKPGGLETLDGRPFEGVRSLMDQSRDLSTSTLGSPSRSALPRGLRLRVDVPEVHKLL